MKWHNWDRSHGLTGMIVYVGTPSIQEDQQPNAWATQSSTVTLKGKPRCTGNLFLLVTQWRQWLLGFPPYIIFSLCDTAQMTFRWLLDQYWFTCIQPYVENSACHSYNYVSYVFRVLCACKFVRAGASAKFQAIVSCLTRVLRTKSRSCGNQTDLWKSSMYF